MVAPLRHGGQCVYCAFHSRRLALQSLRLKQCSTKRLFHSTSNLEKDDIGRRGRGHKRLDFSRQNKYERPDEEDEDGALLRKTVAGKGDGFFRKTGSREPLMRLMTSQDANFSRNRRLAVETSADFSMRLDMRLNAIKEELSQVPLLEQLRKENEEAGKKVESFEEIWEGFAAKLRQPPAAKHTPFLGKTAETDHDRLMASLQDAYATRGNAGLDSRLKYAFYSHIISPRFTQSDITNQRTLADLRYPSEWFPATRRNPRTIHLHVGPTNSGKTYHALQRLEQAASGVYAGPLRLLAHEVYTRMTAKGKKCSLITGEERRLADKENVDYGSMSACTVEMVPLNRPIDVAVIDEIQMIGNAERGWAWTQAFLGVRAKEIHLCGEERTVPLVREICASLGEQVHIHRYERLSPLEMEGDSLKGKLSNLRKGDCIVSFSVMGIHALRREIERATGKKVATVYGSLPPETRAQQARLFNDPDNEYDFLVASDAVGMGLNLAIKRIIFEASNKYDGHSRRTLSVADIKQIAGRAGRYKIASFQSTEAEKEDSPEELAKEDLGAAKGEEPPAVVVNQTNSDSLPAAPSPSIEAEETKGLITTLEPFDYPIVRAAMTAAPDAIRTAGLFPPAPILERFAAYFPPSTPFSYILTRLHELTQMHPRFHLCGLKDQVWIADLIEGVQGLSVTDRNVICSCPAGTSDKDLWVKLMPALAKCIADQAGGAIYDIEALPLEILEVQVSASRQYLRELEQLHKGIVAYLWLSYRFAGVFYTRSVAFHVKSMVEEKIEEVLSQFSFTEANRRRLAAAREKQLMEEMEAIEKAGKAGEGEEGEGASTAEEGEGEGEEDGEGEDGRGLQEVRLREQTTLTSGGDHFGGEEEIGFEDGLEDEETDGEASKASSFAQWHQQETRSPSEDQASTSDQDTDKVEAYNTPSTDAGNDNLPQDSRPASPKPVEPQTDAEEPTNKAAGFKQFGAGVPPKHLAHLDVDAKPVEKDWASRP